MTANLKGKTALITGSSKRIGRAIALKLASAGVNIIVHYNKSQPEAKELVNELNTMGVRGWPLQADLSAPDEINTLVERASALAGEINILVNNASAFPRTSLDDLTLESLHNSIKTDAWAPFVLSRSFAAKPGAQHIVNMLDTRIVSNYDWGHVGYLAAKHMLALFTKMMAIQFAPAIAVNGIAPGLILPPEGKGMDYLESLKDELPLKRIGDPEYIAEAVLFLVSSEFITGQVIFVDGGRHLHEAGSG